MTTLYTPEVHPRIAQRLSQEPPEGADSVAPTGRFAGVNKRLGLMITVAAGSIRLGPAPFGALHPRLSPVTT